MIDSPQNSHDQTRLFYDNPIHAAEYKERTDKIDLSSHYARVLKHTTHRAGLKVLDLGCGPGRDTAFFLSRSFDVTSIDASSAMIELTRVHNPKSYVQSMEDLDATNEFDLVWASASLLHLPRSMLPTVFQKIKTSLRPAGIFYSSYKLGDEDWVDPSGRFFSLVTEAEIISIVETIPEFKVLDTFQSASLEGNATTWFNLILQKQ